MTGLVLEGGAMRGMFTAGVLDVLMQQGICLDGAVGVSAGAVFGCNYKSGQAGRVIRYNKQYCTDPRYVSVRNLLQTGDLYGEDFCYRRLPEELDPFDAAAYQANPMPFWVVCTDARTGRPVYHLCMKGDREDIRWMQASASMPMVSRPVSVGEALLSDGGTADSIPLRFLEDQGYSRNVVVLTRPEGYVKQPVAHRRVLGWALHAYPKLAEALMNRPAMYNETLAYVRKQEEAGNALVIRPPQPLTVGAVEHHPQRLEQAYQMGVDAAAARLTDIRAFLTSQA